MTQQETFGPGSRVWHDRFGEGLVKAVRASGQRVVAFDQIGTRLIHPDHLVDPEQARQAQAMAATWPVGTFVREAPGVLHPMGSRWAVFDLDAETVLGQLPNLLADARLQDGWGSFHRPATRTEPEHWSKGVQLVWPTADHGMGLVLQIEQGENRLVSLFPFNQKGTQATLQVQSVTVWKNGLQAQITALWGNVLITFHDNRHVVDRAWYVAEQQAEFILAGLAYDARPAEVVTLPFNQSSDMAARLKAIFPEGWDDLQLPTALSLQGATIWLPIEDGDADDYEFRGQVRHVRPFDDWLGQDGWTVCITVMCGRSDGEDRVLDIHITRHAWAADAPPQVGQDIEGHLWLQGHLWRASGPVDRAEGG